MFPGYVQRSLIVRARLSVTTVNAPEVQYGKLVHIPAGCRAAWLCINWSIILLACSGISGKRSHAKQSISQRFVSFFFPPLNRYPSSFSGESPVLLQMAKMVTVIRLQS